MKSLPVIAKASTMYLAPALLLLPLCAFPTPRVAAQKDNRLLTQKRTETITAWPGQSKRWALVIGVDQYRDSQISPLKGAANDARALADSL